MKLKKLLILLMFFIVLSISGCIHNDDGNFVLEKTNVIIDYIQNAKKTSIKEMFAKNIICQVEELDKQIDELCKYWQGDFVSLSSGGVGGEGSRDYGVYIDIVYGSYEIKTTKSNYLLATYWYRRDDTDENNVGIWYLWVDSYTDNETPKSIGKWENYKVGITLM